MRNRTVAAGAVAFLCVTVLNVPASASASGWGASWYMNEAPGSTRMYDSSGNHNTGKLGKGVTAEGGLYRFRGKGSVIVPDDSSLDPGWRDFTFSARVRMTGGYADPNLVQKGEYGSRGGQWKMDYWHGWGFCKFIGSNRQLSVRVGFRLNDGNWHTIVCEKRASSISISVTSGSGQAKRNVAHGAIGSITSPRPVSIGGKALCPNGQCDRFTGYMDWVIVRLL